MTALETMPGNEQQVSELRSSDKALEPVELSGAIEHLRSEDLTPAIGREYYDVNIVDDPMNAENSDDRMRDLALASKSHQ
jgi:hypothetical protein